MPPKIKLEIESLSREGETVIGFNQPLYIPPYVDELKRNRLEVANSTSGARALKEIGVHQYEDGTPLQADIGITI